MRRRRKCTWCFEFRNLQISILQGIALIHLLSAKGQDIVHDHHHPLQGHRPLGACLLPALYPHHHTELEPRLQPSSCTHLWSTQQGTACATREAQESSALGTGTVWQDEEVAEARNKAKSGRL